MERPINLIEPIKASFVVIELITSDQNQSYPYLALRPIGTKPGEEDLVILLRDVQPLREALATAAARLAAMEAGRRCIPYEDGEL